LQQWRSQNFSVGIARGLGAPLEAIGVLEAYALEAGGKKETFFNKNNAFLCRPK